MLFRSWASDYNALHQALDAVSSGQAPPAKQSTKMMGPVARAMGHVQEVMKRGGPQAARDLWLAGFPMALAGSIATLFSPLSPDERGIAAALVLALGMLATIGLVATWAFG